jgi:peptide/nickel transport system substrate-binding protein
MQMKVYPLQTTLIIALFFLILFNGCRREEPVNKNFVVIGISSDLESINPLFAFSQEELKIAELLYLPLIRHEWDDEQADLIPLPSLAESWEWNEDTTFIILKLRDNVFWSDGRKFTSEDVVFSFDIYSDPLVNSRLYGTFINFVADNRMHINLDSTFIVTDSFSVIINFKKNSAPSLYNIDFPLLPKHVFAPFNREELANAINSVAPVTNGAFMLESWNRNQNIILAENRNSVSWSAGMPEKLIFKIIPDYNSRLTQLRNGEIDFAEDIQHTDAEALSRISHLTAGVIPGREYDYIGWNNLDVDSLKNGVRYEHKFFGSSRIRKALSHAINRDEILAESLGSYGDAAFGPVTPIFEKAYNKNLKPYEFNPQLAKNILSEEGWSDKNKNGIVEKNGTEFIFTLHIPSGNPRRSFAAAIVKNNLLSVGINARIVELEPAVFFERMFNRELDAWMAGWSVPIPPDPKPYFHSDAVSNPLNVMNYENREANKILEQASNTKSPEERNSLLLKLQEVLYEDPPVTFLYWIDNIFIYNNRIKNIKEDPLGPVHYSIEWRTAD